MDHDLISSLLRGCKMAKDLESNLQSMSNQQLAESCEEIIRVFSEARVRLSVGSRGQDVLIRPLQMQSSQEGMMNTRIQEYVTRMLHTQLMGGSSTGLIEGISSSMGAAGGSSSSAGLVIELGGRGDQVHASETSVMASSSSQRQRRRKDEGEKRREMVAAPQSGNTEIPPDDGFTWRKYGQKEILGSKFPRGYYRCTHQKLYNCPAKKQVQRMDENPSIYEVTYRGEHTCHKSATAPSVAPSPPPETTLLQHHQYHQPLGEWLEFRLGGADSSAAPSTSNVNRNADQFPVADMADVMFNSGSSSSNSMDFIFCSSMDEKWDSGDKK